MLMPSAPRNYPEAQVPITVAIGAPHNSHTRSNSDTFKSPTTTTSHPATINAPHATATSNDNSYCQS
ncbi:hypothetical protein BGY98DRAFT_994838 [Russula aff. rugulosa BPL654]|nr:hypothetical protein BGY98DRAFT_994838 [Russula aff. rugulosa BPL654]